MSAPRYRGRAKLGSPVVRPHWQLILELDETHTDSALVYDTMPDGRGSAASMGSGWNRGRFVILKRFRTPRGATHTASHRGSREGAMLYARRWMVDRQVRRTARARAERSEHRARRAKPQPPEEEQS